MSAEILIVDDNTDIRNIINELIQDAGYLCNQFYFRTSKLRVIPQHAMKTAASSEFLSLANGKLVTQ